MAKQKKQKQAQKVNDMMKDESYIQSCSNIISNALKNGFDVLQLENGDIITKGTKVVSYHYVWDDSKKQMVEVLLSDAQKKLK